MIPTIIAKAKSCRVAPPKISSDDDREQGREAGRQRAGQHLAHRAVDDLREGRPRHPRHVLADSVEDDDRVVERVAEDGQEGGDRPARHLPAGQRVDARGDQDVVEDRDQHRHRELRVEAEGDVGADHQQREDQRLERAVGDLLAEGRADAGAVEAVSAGSRTRRPAPSAACRPGPARAPRAWIWKTLSPRPGRRPPGSPRRRCPPRRACRARLPRRWACSARP